MISNEFQHKNSDEDIIKTREAKNEKTDDETQKLLLKLINEIIVGTFSSYEQTKEDFYLINTKYFQIKQYYTYNQTVGSSLCGFHSLFNIYYFLKFLTSKELNQQIYSLFNLKNAWSFWSFYKDSINFLLTNLKLEPKAEQSIRNEGPLERYQFIYLLNELPKMKELFNEVKLNYDVSLTKFLFGFGIFNGTIEEGIDFQEKINKFIENNNLKREKILIILLGIVNHWNVLIFYKNNQNKIDIDLLDSRNSPEIFNSIELYDEINDKKDNKEKIEKLKDEYINSILKKKLKNKKLTEWDITCRKDWYDSMNKSIILIFKILLKKVNLLNYIIDNKINLLLNNFYSKTNIDLIKIENENKLKNINYNKDQIYKWIKEDYHPALFNDEILKDIIKVKYIIKDKKFILWIKFMKTYLNDLKYSKFLNEIDKDISSRYTNYLNELDKYIFQY